VTQVAAARYGGDEEAALEEVYEDDELADASYPWALLGCLRAAPALLDHVRRYLADPDPRVQEAATQAETRLLAATRISSEHLING
jgi:hypothetical protein